MPELKKHPLMNRSIDRFGGLGNLAQR